MKSIWVLGAAGFLAVALALFLVYKHTQPTRSSVQTFFALIGAANRGDVATAEGLCSKQYRQTHQITLALHGGIEGLPRNIHKNFQVWRDGEFVLLCPTNRVGPVYRFVYEDSRWKFDGPIGLLQSDGALQPFVEETETAGGF